MALANSVSNIILGQVRPGLSLNYNQQLVQFAVVFTDQVGTPYAIPWVQGPLAPGAKSHIYNLSTGLVSPYTVAKGYSLSIIEIRSGFNQDMDGWLYLDGLLVSQPFLDGSGLVVLETSIAKYNSTIFDPTAASPHTVDLILINRGLGNMLGGALITCILEAIGTPPFPTNKDTGCPFCGNINRVVVAVTTIKCSKCGKTYYVFDTTSIKWI